MWLNPQELADLVTFTEEILNGNFHFLCSVCILGSNLWVLFCDQGRRGIILAALPLPLETVEPVHLNGASSILLSKDSLGTGGNWFFVKKYQGTLQILLLFFGLVSPTLQQIPLARYLEVLEDAEMEMLVSDSEFNIN